MNCTSKTGVESTGEYLTQEEDRQVGLGMLGLANLLALLKDVKLCSELRRCIASIHLYDSTEDLTLNPVAINIVKALKEGIDSAAAVANAWPIWIVHLLLHQLHLAPIATKTEQAIQLLLRLAPPIGMT